MTCLGYICAQTPEGLEEGTTHLYDTACIHLTEKCGSNGMRHAPEGEGLRRSAVSLEASHAGGGGHRPHPDLSGQRAGAEHGGGRREGEAAHRVLVTEPSCREEQQHQSTQTSGGGRGVRAAERSSHLQPLATSQTSMRPSKDVVARRPSFRNTQLEMPSQLLTSDFTSCSQPGEEEVHTSSRNGDVSRGKSLVDSANVNAKDTAGS
ncbi:hypothetical protein EYF80_034981 [Liparis tanakae]|uniref:Uncharacterized protein n=1 Tax=Liparis tanakae TaxID=230148 RepID=A0A4Z2GNQ1_9TELE|nr:hypothetical protein EYF80_034981 [Liparis tanakae]